MYYRHNLDYQYPEVPDEHMIAVKHVRELSFDEAYPYLPEGLGYKFLRGCYWLLLNGIVFPVMRLSHGLRIYGKKNLKKHKKALKNGAITVSNHVCAKAVLPVNHGAITAAYTANRPLCAPISAGDPVGELIFSCDGTEIARIPLCADTALTVPAPAPSLFERIQSLFNNSD
jgi:hypothetical protein